MAKQLKKKPIMKAVEDDHGNPQMENIPGNQGIPQRENIDLPGRELPPPPKPPTEAELKAEMQKAREERWKKNQEEYDRIKPDMKYLEMKAAHSKARYEIMYYTNGIQELSGQNAQRDYMATENIIDVMEQEFGLNISAERRTQIVERAAQRLQDLLQGKIETTP
jgi:hypothetical protein